MRITRKVFSIYSEDELISAIEEKAFCEGYQAAQKEFAEEEESRDRNRKIGVGLTGIGAVGAGIGLGKTLYDVHDNKTFFNKQIEDLPAKMSEQSNKLSIESRNKAMGLKDKLYDRHLKAVRAMGLIEKSLPTNDNIEERTKAKDMLKRMRKHLHNRSVKITSDHIDELRDINEKFINSKAIQDGIEKLKGEAALNKGKIIKSGALKYGLPALAVTGIGAGMMYKNRKKKD